MKKLINIRGGVATGKTTAVRQFCERRGFSVEQIDLGDAVCSLSIIDNGRIVVLGDYLLQVNCTGIDRWRFKNGKSATKTLIKRAIVEVIKRYKPEIIVYEHMLTSQLCKSTCEIADTAGMFGYQYYGVQLYIPETTREKWLNKRSGVLARKKNFFSNAKRVNRATEMLNAAGYRVVVKNVETWQKERMWEIVEDAIEAAV